MKPEMNLTSTSSLRFRGRLARLGQTLIWALCLLLVGTAYGLNLGIVSQQNIFAPDSGPWTTPQTENKNACHCATIVQTTDGTIIAAWRNGPDRIPNNAVYAADFVNGSWTTPRKIAGGEELGLDHTLENPTLFQPVGGPLMLFFYGGPGFNYGYNFRGYLKTSTDNGQTWSAVRALGDAPGVEGGKLIGPTKNPPLQLPDGTILVPSSNEPGLLASQDWSKLTWHFEKSTDMGNTWSLVQVLPVNTTYKSIQPGLLNLGNGRLRALGRNEGSGSATPTASSANSGASWTGISGLSNLLQTHSAIAPRTTKEGTHIVVYNPSCCWRLQLDVVQSGDGTNWGNPFTVVPQSANKMAHYPQAVETADNKLHLVFTYSNNDSTRSQCTIRHVVLDPRLPQPAERLASWNFLGLDGRQAQTQPEANAPHITAAPITRGAGLGTDGSNDSMQANNWTTAASIDANDYFQFGFTVAAGYKANVKRLLFTGRRNLYGPQKIELRGSLDNYASAIQTWTTPADENVDYYVTLPPASFSNVLGTLTFRLYGYSSTPNQTPQAFKLFNYFFRDGLNIKGHAMRVEGEVSSAVAPPPPAGPSALTAMAVSSSQINLAWTDNANNEDGFKIERKTGAGGTWAPIATVGANVTTYQNTGLTHQTTYYYRVRAYNAGGDSDYSNEANATTFALTPPAAPSSLTATAVSATRINLAWTDNATNEAGFKIERKTRVGGTWAEVAAAGVNGTTFANTGLTPKTTYYYRVAATNSAGASAWSNEAQATTLEADPLPDVCLPQTGQTQSSTAGDDGDLQQGVAWPNPRFTDNGNGTVTDNLTGLIWLKKADNAVMTWTNALIFCNDLADGTSGLTDGSAAGDWRLPNINELRSLWNLNKVNPTLPDPHPFTGVQNAGYWSSTPRIASTTEIINVNLGIGTSGAATRTSTLRVLAVRGSGCVPKTGRTQADGPRADGELQAGVAWPNPRFTDNGDGTVRDYLTGLVWTKNANPLGNLAWTNAVAACRGLASGSGGLSDGSVAGDWRLPNVNELRSLLNYGVASGPALPAGHPFTGVVNGAYWSSTRRPVLQGPLNVNFSTGAASDGSATTATAVWPVRDGAGIPPVPVAARFVGIEWLANGVLQLSATGGLSQTYILQGATNLTPPVVWQPVATNTASGGAVQFLDISATNHPQRYYRAVTP